MIVTSAPRPIVVELPWAKPPLSLNDRDHWAAKSRKVKRLKTEAAWAIRAARVEPMLAAEVCLVWRVPDWVRRDLDNPIASLKPVTDALVDCGVLPADDWTHVRAAQVRIVPPDAGGPPVASVWLEITPTEPVVRHR